MFERITENWQSIAGEVKSLPRDFIDVSHLKTRVEAAAAVIESGKLQWVKGWDGYGDWLAWGVMLQGQFLGGAPITESFLKDIPGLNFAAFLNLKAGTVLKNHAHPENTGIMTYHLGLDVPEECYLKTDGKFYFDKNGKGYVFDGTKPHYAFNASDKDRLILHCEFAV